MFGFQPAGHLVLGHGNTITRCEFLLGLPYTGHRLWVGQQNECLFERFDVVQGDQSERRSPVAGDDDAFVGGLDQAGQLGQRR